MWEHSFLARAVTNVREGDQEFWASLGYVASPCLRNTRHGQKDGLVNENICHKSLTTPRAHIKKAGCVSTQAIIPSLHCYSRQRQEKCPEAQRPAGMEYSTPKKSSERDLEQSRRNPSLKVALSPSYTPCGISTCSHTLATCTHTPTHTGTYTHAHLLKHMHTVFSD